jgi:hypothetical protein
LTYIQAGSFLAPFTFGKRERTRRYLGRAYVGLRDLLCRHSSDAHIGRKLYGQSLLTLELDSGIKCCEIRCR